MTAPAKVVELRDRFHQHADDYRGQAYNEARLR